METSELPLANWNGEVLPLAEVKIPATDRGFLFGDAVYEVVRIFQGKPVHLREHWERLARSLAGLEITCNLERLQKRLLSTVEASGVDQGMVYIQITRGSAPRQHRFPSPTTEPNELLYVNELKRKSPDEVKGIKVTTTPDLRWRRCDLKTTNLLANVLANELAFREGGGEVLFFNDHGLLTEASHSNLFVVMDGILRTAPTSMNILAGITRKFVLELATKNNIPVVEEAVSLIELKNAEEILLTGTISEIMPVLNVDDQIKFDGIGPITKRLILLLR
jgi:D-alanine transaminase